MLFRAHADGRFELEGRTLRCAIGKTGAIAAKDKRERRREEPGGRLGPCAEVWYRPDVYHSRTSDRPARRDHPTAHREAETAKAHRG